MSRSLYDVLGVAPDATQAQIRRAFQEKSRRIHPDKNRNDPKATEKFQELSEAYDILKDPDRRRQYDMTGSGDGLAGIFSSFFGPFGFDTFAVRPRRKTPAIEHILDISLRELFTGSVINLPITRMKLCRTCGGSGLRPGARPVKCKSCLGTGRTVSMRQHGPTFIQEVSDCKSCDGAGETVRAGDFCPKCNGKATVKGKDTINVVIDPGMRHGEEIVFHGMADEKPGADTGDFVVQLNVVDDCGFERNGNHLLLEKTVTLSQWLLQEPICIEQLDGRVLVVDNPPCVNLQSFVRRIPKEGMPARGHKFRKGDLFLKFTVAMPNYSELSEELITELRRFIPAQPELDELDPNDPNVHFVQLQDADIADFGAGFVEDVSDESDYSDDISAAHPFFSMFM